MLKRKIGIVWSCSDASRHEHGSKLAAWACGRVQSTKAAAASAFARFVIAWDRLDWRVSIAANAIEEELGGWFPYSIPVAIIYAIVAFPWILISVAMRGLIAGIGGAR